MSDGYIVKAEVLGRTSCGTTTHRWRGSDPGVITADFSQRPYCPKFVMMSGGPEECMRTGSFQGYCLRHAVPCPNRCGGLTCPPPRCKCPKKHLREIPCWDCQKEARDIKERRARRLLERDRLRGAIRFPWWRSLRRKWRQR